MRQNRIYELLLNLPQSKFFPSMEYLKVHISKLQFEKMKRIDMGHKRILYILAVASLITTGCMGSGNGYGQGQGHGRGGGKMQKYPSTNSGSSSISGEVKSSLAYMYEEERLAKEVYQAIYRKQKVQQLYKISSNSEGKHIDAVKRLAQRYGVQLSPQQVGHYQDTHIQSLFNQLYSKGIRSQKDALEVGCIVEVTDIEDLNKYISDAQQANAQDVLQVYNFLQRGSYNHYWAFDRGLKQLGVSNGCCSLGGQYCHNEYH
jgi:hypothetical protein